MSAAVPSMAAQPAWRVRAMRESDLEAVVRIEESVYPFPWTRGNFADSLRSHYDAWVFEGEGELLGYALLMWLPDEVHLLNLSVAAPWQSRGLGRAFLDWICENLARRRAASLMLEVRPSNAPARALYDRKGFRLIGVRRDYYPAPEGRREEALVLRLGLIHE